LDTIAGIRRSLEQSRDRAESDLQKTVHQRIGDFVRVTKELAGFESKMNELHGIINQLSSLSENLLANVPQVAGEQQQQQKVEEETDLLGFAQQSQSQQQMPGVDLVERAAKISRVLEHVDGLDSLLADGTARYILHEGVDLQLALVSTGKPAIKSIYLYVLNDGLLMTGKKVSRNPLGSAAKRKFALEAWIPFAELHYEDVKDPGLLDAHNKPAYGLRLTKGTTVHGTILFDSPATKKLWLDQLKRAIIQYKMEEASLNATLNLQLVKERQVKKTTRSGLAARAGHRRAASSTAHRRAAEAAAVASAAGSTDLSDEKWRSLLNFLDDLDQASSLRKYDQATELVESVLFNLKQLSDNGLGDAPRIHALRKTVQVPAILRETSEGTSY